MVTSRFVGGGLAVVVLAAAVVSLRHLGDVALLPTAHWSGWLLFLTVLLLCAQGLYRARSQAPASVSVRIHVYVGWIAVVVFAVHAGDFPDGWFYRLLWTLFALALGSGVAGLMVQHFCANRRQLWDPIPHHQIARRRASIAAEVDAAFHDLVDLGCPPAVAALYARAVLPLLSGPSNLWGHWIGSGRPLAGMLRELDHAGADVRETAPFVRIRSLLVEKDQLDERWAIHWLEQAWLFVHVPASAASVVLIVFHIVFVHAFGG